MQVLRQSTERIVRVGPFVDATDGVTPETGVTLGAADQTEAMKTGGGASVDISAATWAAVTGADGWYDLTLSTSVTDTVGDLTIVVQDASVCLPVMVRFTVVEEAVYDMLYGASAQGYITDQAVNATKWGGTAVASANVLIDGAITAAKLAADCITADKIADDAIGTEHWNVESVAVSVLSQQDIADEVWADSIGAQVASDTAAILLDTGTDGVVVAGDFSATMQGTLLDAIDSKLVAIGLDHLMKTAVTGTDVADNTVIAKLVSKSATADWDTYNPTTDSLEAIRDQLVVVDEVVDAVLEDTAVIGAAGAGLTAVPWNAAWDAEVQSECADALIAVNLDHLMLTGDATLTNIVADNTALAHLMAIGADISDYDSSTDSLEGIAGAGGGGAPTVEQIRTEIDNNSTKLAAILEDTGTTLPATLATIDGVVDDILEGFDTTGFDSTDYLTDIKTTMEGAGGHLALILEDTGTTIPAALTTIDNEIAVIDAIADKLDTAMELDGAVYRFTVNALEQAPAGGGAGSTDWTADERTAIRSILGIPAAGTTPEDPTAGALSDILSGYDDTGFDSEQFVDDVAAAVLAEIGTGWSEPLTEAYPAYGATPTAAQMLWMIYAGMLQRELDGTTLNILESDGATAAAVFTITLNTQGYPTKVVRTS